MPISSSSFKSSKPLHSQSSTLPRRPRPRRPFPSRRVASPTPRNECAAPQLPRSSPALAPRPCLQRRCARISPSRAGAGSPSASRSCPSLLIHRCEPTRLELVLALQALFRSLLEHRTIAEVPGRSPKRERAQTSCPARGLISRPSRVGFHQGCTLAL